MDNNGINNGLNNGQTNVNANLFQGLQQPMQHPEQSMQQSTQFQQPNQQFQQQSVQQPKQKSGNNKKIFLLIIAIVVIVLLVFVIKHFFVDGNVENSNKLNRKFETSFAKYDADSLIPVKKDDKYGYINSDGEIVIEPQYEEASQFYGDYAEVKLYNEKGRTVEHIIDKNGISQLSDNFWVSVDYIDDYNFLIIDGKLYDSSLKKLSSDEVKVYSEDYGYLKWKNTTDGIAGIMDLTGKITYTYKLKNDEKNLLIDPADIDEDFKERYCVVIIDNEKYAIVNCDTGKVIYDYTDNYIFSENDNIFSIWDDQINDVISRIYIQNDKIIYQTTDEDIDLKYYNGYVLIKDEKKGNSYIDVKTGKITDKKPSSLGDIDISSLDKWEKNTDYIKFSCDDGYGLKKDGNIKLTCEWSYIKYFDLTLYKYLSSKGMEYVLADNAKKSYLINLKDGKVVTEFNISDCWSIKTYEDSTFIYYEDEETGKYVFYNLITGKSLTVESASDIDLYANYVTIKENNKLNYYNMNLKLIYTEE